MSHQATFYARRRLAVMVAAAVAGTAAQARNSDQSTDMEEVEIRAEVLDRRGLSLDAANGAGTRLGLSSMDTPASVEIVSKEDIAVKGDFSGNAAVTRATGFASSASPGNGGTSASVRGFNGHSSVVNTYDGTRLYIGAGTVSFPADTWTVERVEVLRGPGSVINGVGAIGATVNYEPRRPEFEPIETEFALVGGSNDLARLALGSGGALTDTVAFRLDAVSHTTDGYVDRAEEDRNAVAGALLFRPTDALDIRLSVDYADTKAAPYWGTPLVDGAVPSDIRRNNYNVADAIVAYEDLWPRLHLNWRINDSLELRSDTFDIESERHWRNVESYSYNPATGDVDRAFYLEILHDQEQVGNRTDLLWKGTVAGMENRLSVGAEVNSMNFSHINNSPYRGESSVDLDNPVPGHWRDGVGSVTTPDFDSDTTQGAVFVDNVLSVTEQWQVVAGLRYDRIDHERVDRARSNGQEAGEIDSELSGTSWRLGAVYQPSENTSFYLQASTAVDSIQSILSATDPDLDLAEGEQVEAGVRQQFLDGRLQYTLALYDITKTDLVSTDPGGVQRQVGEQRSRGIEFEMFWLPLDNLSVDLNMAFTDPEYEDFVSGDSDYSGNTPRSVPEQIANLWLTWQVVPAWTLSGGVRYVGERYLNDANTAELPDYAVWDATLQWQVADGLQLSLRGKNLSDTEDNVLSPYGGQWILGDGRTAEVGVSYRL